MPTNPTAIVDAIQTDLAGLRLNPAATWSYAEPTVITPDQCPLLAVWTEETTYQILTGAAGLQAYERHHQVVVEWIVYSSLMADTGGTGDPATVKALEQTAETITNRIETYSSGIPGLTGGQLVATLTRRQLAPKAGTLWSARIELTAEEAA